MPVPRTALAVLLVALLAVPVAALAAPVPHDDCATPMALPVAARLALDPDVLRVVDPLAADDPESHPCLGKIQPGALLTAPFGCTLAWILKDETGALYAATAGHCIGKSGVDGTRVDVYQVGRIGVSVYNVNEGPGLDFGIVKLDPGVYHRVDPTLCHWGGPNKEATFGPRSGIASDVKQVLQYGWGFATQWHGASRARAHYAPGHGSSTFNLEGMISSGDSGSPAMFADGSAAGVVTHAVGVVVAAAGPGTAQRLDVGIAMAEAHTGRTFTLVTSETPVTFPLGS